MPVDCNAELKRIADKTAISMSCVPVFVCDSDLRICTKSVGARQLLPRPSVKNSMKKYFSEDDIRRIYTSEGHVFKVSLGGARQDYIMIVTSGEIEGERYYCFIVRLNIIFCPSSEPWYIKNACDSLSAVAHELLLTKASDYSELDRYCELISRLCVLSEHQEREGGFPKLADAPLQRIMRTLDNECSKLLPHIGVSVEINTELERVLVSEISSKTVYTMISILIVSLITIAKNDSVNISCGCRADSENTACIDIKVISDISEHGEISCFDDLVNIVIPLRLELGALSDIAKSNSVSLDCHIDGETLTISMEFAVRSADNLVFRAEDTVCDETYLAELLTELCRLITEK